MLLGNTCLFVRFTFQKVMDLDIHDLACRYQFSYSAIELHGIMALYMERLQWFMIFLIFIPNLIIIISLYASSKKLFFQEKLVMLLSVVDLSVAIILTPLKIHVTANFNNLKCLQIATVAFWHLFPTMISSFVVIVISVERYFTVVHNKIWHKIKIKNIYFMYVLFLLSIGSFALSLWFALAIEMNLFSNLPYIYSSIGFVTLFYLIFAVLTNILLLIGTKKILKSSDINVQRNIMVGKKLNKTIMLISIALVVLYLPSVVAMAILVASMKTGFGLLAKISRILLSWSLLFSQTNSMINSLIYIFRSQKILNYLRIQLVNIFRKRCT
ncbi:uncharacterized protein LOC136079769 isoform X2 [Hydra vulgaris]|uniref:Uncharacterized protein LOC136079769 isoform X2 n=1 Tax=Hydra vulgaris TaxID=6087 RepID=A0ABM4BSR4_HYDVU